ncbi:MAG TPA: enoyl-CoA hydratase [Stellaceae bacterium]
MSDGALVLRVDRDSVATLTLNRPNARNALSVAMMSALQTALDEIAADDSVRVAVLAGAGPAFCAGHDLKELRANPGRQAYETVFGQCARLMTSIVMLPKPVIARVQGVATAAGCQLVASCDLAIAADDARFATPGVNIGLFCSTPMVALSRTIGRKQAMEMLLTGSLIDADTARAWGLINRVVPGATLEDAAATLAAEIAAKSPLTVAIGKRAFYAQAELGLAQAYAYCAEVMTTNMLARDAEEGIDAFLEKRKPLWQGR